MRGYIQVYTGKGKGKTTAAFGLALRAAGAGMKVFIAQFMKGGEYSELKSISKFEGLITVRQYGRGSFIREESNPEKADIICAAEGLKEVMEILRSGEYHMIILDEANIAVHFKLFPVSELLKIMDAKPSNVELVITGRNADPQVLEKADLVTEMHAVKHYYDIGVQARIGIEK